MARVVIVGGGGTGDYAAFAVRKRGCEGEVVILSADHDRPYDRPYLSKEFLRGEVDLPKVYLHPEADYGKERIELRLDQRVSGGSLAERRVVGQGGGEVTFDGLVVGPRRTAPRPPRIPTAPAARNPARGKRLHASLAARQPGDPPGAARRVTPAARGRGLHRRRGRRLCPQAGQGGPAARGCTWGAGTGPRRRGRRDL